MILKDLIEETYQNILQMQEQLDRFQSLPTDVWNPAVWDERNEMVKMLNKMQLDYEQMIHKHD